MTAEPAEPAGVEICGRCRQVRPRRALTRVPGPEGEPQEWRCTEPCKGPGGRPAIGGRFLLTWQPELRAGVEALSLPGESLAETVRRLLAAAVDDAQADQEPSACPACGRWHQGWIPPGCPLSEAAPAPAELPAAELPGGLDLGRPMPDAGPRSVIAETWRGEPVVVGPVYTAKGAADIENAIRDRPDARGWRVIGTVRAITKAQLDWNWES